MAKKKSRDSMVAEKESGLFAAPATSRAVGRVGEMPLVHLLLLALVVLCAYSNTFSVPFILDDQSSITDNRVIRDLSGFLSGAGYAHNPRRFIGYLTFALNYQAGGLEVAGYHAVNVAIHVVNCWLVYALARLTLSTALMRPTAGAPGVLHASLFPLLAALLFAAHPVQTQAVTYIVQRLASLATMFYLMSLVFYALARLRQQEAAALRPAALILFACCALSALLAIGTKEIAATLPFLIVLYELTFFGAGRRKKILLSVACAAVLLVALGMLAGSPSQLLSSDLGQTLRASTDMERGTYLLTQFRVIPTYLRLLLFPVNQNLDYDFPVSREFMAPPVLAGFLLICALIGLALWLYRKPATAAGGSARVAAFGIAWFFLTLSVESSLIPIRDVIFEHRLYLPSAGAFVAFSATLCFLLRGAGRRFLVVTALVLSVALAGASWARNAVWRDAVSIWSDTVEKSPGKSRPHFNLGKVLMLEERIEEAYLETQLAVEIDPEDPEAQTNLAVVSSRKGLVDAALVHYQKAVQISPDYVIGRTNLGGALEEKGRYAEAAEQYREAIRLSPDGFEAHNNLGGVLVKTGRFAEALAQLKRAVDADPGRVEPLVNLGVCSEKTGQVDAAISYYRQAIRLKPEHATAHLNLGNALSTKGHLTQAIDCYREAIRLKPEQSTGYLNLGIAYLKSGSLEKAREQFAAVQRAFPGEPMSRQLLARTLANK